jgi:hypothetical protein
VAHHEVAISGGMDIQLDGVRPRGDRSAHGPQGARRPLPSAPLVGVIEDPAAQPAVVHAVGR